MHPFFQSICYETLQCISEAVDSFREMKHRSQKRSHAPSTPATYMHVFLRDDAQPSSFIPAYKGLYRVLKRYANPPRKPTSVSIDRLKPATLFPEVPTFNFSTRSFTHSFPVTLIFDNSVSFPTSADTKQTSNPQLLPPPVLRNSELAQNTS